MYLSSLHDSMLSDPIQMSGQPVPRSDSGPDCNTHQFNVNCDNQNGKDSFTSDSPLPLNLPVCYQQGGETYYVPRQWQSPTDIPLSDLQHTTLTNRKVIKNADFKFSRTEELSFENSRYHNYVTDSEISVSPADNNSSSQKSEMNVRRLLKENVKQYAKVVNTLPAGGDSNDISSAMFRQMAASCGIHVEDPRSFPDNFKVQKLKTLENISQNLEPSTISSCENPFGDDLSKLDSDMQSMKLEYSTIEVSSKNSEMNFSRAWSPNWMNGCFYSNKAESYSSNAYNCKNVSENQTNSNESIGFEPDTVADGIKPLGTSDDNDSSDTSTRNLFTPVKKDWLNNFLLDSSSPTRDGLPIKTSTPFKAPGFEVGERFDITNVSTQTDFFNPSVNVPKKETYSQGNQTSILLKDASVNTWQLCTCSDPASQPGTPLQSTEITKITDDNAWNPLSDSEELNRQLFDQNLNPASCLTDNYFHEQYTGVTPSSILQSSLRQQYRDTSEYKPSYPEVSPILNTPPPSPEALSSDMPYWGSTYRHSDNFYFSEPANTNEIKLDLNLYCLVLEKLRYLYPGLSKSPHELQLLAKRQTLALQIHRSQLQYSCSEEPRAITKTNPLQISSPKDIDTNKFFHNLSTTISPNDKDLDYLTPDDSLSASQHSADSSELRYVISPTYRKYQAPQTFSAKSDWNSKQLQDFSSKTSAVEWGIGFNPVVTKHDPKDPEKCEEHSTVGSPKMIMKRVEKGGWNSTIPVSINAKTSMKYQNQNPEDCLPVGSNDFQTNNWQQIIKKKKRLQFAVEQKQTLPSKIDANTRKGNYERLVQVILERLPNTDRTKVDELIREVRRRKNGLGGLTMREIVLEAKSIQHEKSRLYSTTPTVVKNENQCALCVEDLKLKSQKLLECGHNFHEECIMAWVYRHKRSCPTCGQLVLFPEDYPKLV